jgi:hypothetical protein
MQNQKDMEDKIRATAELVIQQLGPLSNLPFGYNRESVAWVEGFIEQQRTRPDLDQNAVNGLVNVLGSFLGECIIRCFGGEWRQADEEWHVRFNAENAVYPFNKVRKQFANGAEDSIKRFFETIPVLFKPFLQKTHDPAALESLKQLEQFIRQAEEAYGRLYDEWSRSERAATYNECKESMAEAIQLARQMGLEDKVIELEKKLEHYKHVFRHQMNF